MVGPEDLEKLFPGGLPSWIEKPPPDKKQADSLCFIEGQKPQIVTPDGLVSIAAKLGVVGTSRMYGFYKDDPARMPSQNARPYDALAYATMEDMAPIGKHRGIRSRPFSKGIWCAEGFIEPGTIIKVFVGHTVDPVYGMYFYTADEYAKKIRICHPEGNTFVEGKLTEVNEAMYDDLGLKKLPPRAKGMTVNILEV